MNKKSSSFSFRQHPLTYIAKVTHGQIEGLYSLENNLVVVKIIEAAKKSAKSGKTVSLK